MNPWAIFAAGLVLLLLPMAILSVLMMPLAGVQSMDTIQPVYYLEAAVVFTQIAGGLLALYGLVEILRSATGRVSVGIAVSLAMLAIIATYVMQISQPSALFDEIETMAQNDPSLSGQIGQRPSVGRPTQFTLTDTEAVVNNQIDNDLAQRCIPRSS